MAENFLTTRESSTGAKSHPGGGIEMEITKGPKMRVSAPLLANSRGEGGPPIFGRTPPERKRVVANFLKEIIYGWPGYPSVVGSVK